MLDKIDDRIQPDNLNGQMMAKQLDAIIDSSFDGLWICDGDGKVVRINRASEKINGIKAEQVLNRNIEDIVNEGLFDRSVTLEVLRTRASVTMIQHLKNGKQVLVTGSPVFDDHGKISLVVVNDRDITKLNQLRAELDKTRALSQEYLQKLSQSNQRKSLSSDVVIRSTPMRQAFSTAMEVAQVDTIVLIQGESGVGKGLMAKLIHQASKRNEGPFIRVDCGAIPEALIESELFGYDGGAFTGARPTGKPGHFEMAEGGTFFLDEIGELPLSVQVKLLRFIEENEVVHIGGTQPKHINTRIIAATHRNLEDMVDKALFRRDLFFRLNVVPLKIPPLRERIEDIPPLIHFFLERFNSKCAKKCTILPRTVDVITQYSFPGNIRELANLIERLVVLTPRKRIYEEDLPSHIRDKDAAKDFHLLQNEWNLREAVSSLEKAKIIQALKIFGSQRNAAAPLGVNQSTIARKVKRYGIISDAIVHNDA